MEGTAFVLDISSDEEEGEGEKRKVIKYEWVREFLGVSDEEQTDEVVVVNQPEQPKSSSKCCSIVSTSLPTVNEDKEEEGDDDDCVILDADPDNLVSEVDNTLTGSDELLVVGEKGQIACRDYPHPRHLCGNFPFSSTPHERHCDQCHCYVCDSKAPCLKWGSGLSSIDHCHATDKSEMWKILRKNFKLGKTAPLPASTNYGALRDVGNLQCNHILPLDIRCLPANPMLLNQTMRSNAMHTFSSLNVIPQNQAFQPTIMCPCSSPVSSLPNQFFWPNTVPVCSTFSNFTAPHDANHGRSQESGSTLARNRYLSHSFPRQLLGVRNHAIQKDRGCSAIGLGHQFLGSHTMSKKVGIIGSALTANHSNHVSSGFSNNVNPAWQYGRYHAATGFSNSRTHGQNAAWVPQNVLQPQSNSEVATMSHVNKYTTAYGTQAYPGSNDNQNFYGSCVQGNGAPSSYVSHLNKNQHLNEHHIGGQNENALPNIMECGITRQEACQQKPHDEGQTQSGSSRKAYIDSGLAGNTNESISYLQSSRSINQPPNAKGSGTQFTGSTNLSSVDDIMQCLFDEQDSVPVVADNALAYEMKIPSPDLSTIDPEMFLVDFDDSWDGLSFS